MEIIKDIEKNIEYETTVALGSFDGVHLGHKSLIETAVSSAKASKTTPSIFTFDCNFNKFKLGLKDTLLLSNLQKETILKQLGIELLYRVEFSSEMKNMTPEQFVREMIIKKLNAKTIVVGFNFRFGCKASGDIETLKSLSKKYKFNLVVIPPVVKDKALISSTLIRGLINQGKITDANQLLGRNYSVRGKVIRGKGRGKKLGFATANLKTEVDYVYLKKGVYKTMVYIRGKKYKSITNIGVNPTFSDVSFSIETHIIDFKQDIYGEDIEIEFLDFIRKEKKFDSVKDLVKQVNIDINKVKQ